MTLTVTDRGLAKTTAGNSATNTVTSTSFTPSAGDMMTAIVAGLFADGGSGAVVFSVTDTHAGTSAWTERVTVTQNAGGGYSLRASIFTAIAGATPGAGTITVTRSGSFMDQWLVADFPSIAGSAGIGTTGSVGDLGTTTTLAITMAAAPASTSLLLGGIIDNDGTSPITQPSGWTELQDTSDAAAGDDVETAYINTGGSQTFNWSALTGGTGFGRVAVALEITDTAGGSPFIPRSTMARQAVRRAATR